MKQLEKYEACDIEIMPLADVVTSSLGFDGDVDEYDYDSSSSVYTTLEPW